MAKMSSSERHEFYRKAFDEQRHLLRTAIDGMGTGDLAQALHVATTIRVLVHETGASKPLLKHLDNNYWEMPIFEWTQQPAPKAPPGVQSITFFCPVNAQFKAPEGTVSLITELKPENHTVSKLGAWWANACMMLPGVGPVTRRELILGLSNKEGGAHVDADISEKYTNLLASRFFCFKINDVELGPIRISRLVAGKAGVELLDCLDRKFPV
jgi:hypothetical protein